MISDLINNFGGDGYLVFFGILDMMAEDFDENNPGISTFSCHYLTQNLQLSRQKLVRILTFLQNYPKNKGKLLHEINGKKIIVSCSRLKDLADDWTKRTLRSSSVVAPAQEVEVEVEVEVEKKNVKKKSLTLLSLFETIEGKFTAEQLLKHKFDFLDYWKEKKQGGRKERWEMEKVFDVNLRFRNWLRNNDKFGYKKNNPIEVGSIGETKKLAKKWGII